MQNLDGLGIALVTPFTKGKVDFESLSGIIDHTLKGGCDFLVSLGTTGETSTLSEEEALAVLNFTIKKVDKRCPIVTGLFAGNNTHAIVSKIGAFNFEGIDALLMASPSYNKPTQEGIFQHYMAIAEVSPIPLIIYNVPGRTASNISAETTLRIAKAASNIIGIKEASNNLMQGMQILKHRPENFKVWSGDDPTSIGLLAAGANGVISVIGNAFPGPFRDMVIAALENNYVLARHYNNLLLDLHKWLYIDGNPAGIKAALEFLGLCSAEVRLPLTPLRKEFALQLEAEIQKSGLSLSNLKKI
jgi:4-hydroxy-tetrahydrodipicolinate synthase